ncbi:hypothetical protein FHG87_015386 [Trinorchestia longiramus]|nr:hypothetical protein FHG87_015386 [Trinorchestia longiramus]
MASTADGVLLECVSTIIGRKLRNLAQVVEDEVFLLLMSKLKAELSSQEKFDTASTVLQNSIKEYFLRDDLVDFEKASRGDSLEVSKLLLLLLYMSFIADKNMRTLLSSALNHTLQLKLKHLFECIQKRGSGLSPKYLSIVASENLDRLASSSSSSGQEGRSWGGSSSSSVLYTSSPKAASRQSPLRELVQSPNFVVQRKLESRMKDVKRLNQELTDLETEKQDWLVQQQIYHKRQAKLGRLSQCINYACFNQGKVLKKMVVVFLVVMLRIEKYLLHVSISSQFTSLCSVGGF